MSVDVDYVFQLWGTKETALININRCAALSIACTGAVQAVSSGFLHTKYRQFSWLSDFCPYLDKTRTTFQQLSSNQPNQSTELCFPVVKSFGFQTSLCLPTCLSGEQYLLLLSWLFLHKRHETLLWLCTWTLHHPDRLMSDPVVDTSPGYKTPLAQSQIPPVATPSWSLSGVLSSVSLGPNQPVEDCHFRVLQVLYHTMWT